MSNKNCGNITRIITLIWLSWCLELDTILNSTETLALYLIIGHKTGVSVESCIILEECLGKVKITIDIFSYNTPMIERLQ